MSLDALLRLVVTRLEALGIPYMLTGSLASSYHGVPRSTRDIDVVVDADRGQLLRLGAALREAGLYVSDEAIAEALEARGQFNAIDAESGSKIGIILVKDRPFSREEFAQRDSAELDGLRMSIVRAEDIIVAKLEWARSGESERQLRDVAGILAVRGVGLDRVRLTHWVADLGLEEQWRAALEVERREREST
jgi:hypothetical protein